MNILILGANGRTGQLVTKLAKDKGHEVTGFVRGEYQEIDGVSYISGDVENYEDILNSLKSIDIVISTIGHVKHSDNLLQTNAMLNLVKAADGKNIKIVSLTGTGVRVSGDKITIIDRILNLAINIIDRKRVVDGIKHYKVLKDSNLNWSVLRVLKLSNSQKVSFKLCENGPAKSLVSRLEAANALVLAAESNQWDKKAPIVCK